MKRTFALAAIALTGLQSLGSPAVAMGQDDKNALAAAAILGLAALAHHKDHYREGYQPSNELQAADFERGYRDGLHNEPFDSRVGEHYAQGYDAGQKERANSLSHKTNDVAGVKVPQAAMNSCFNDAVNGVFQTSARNVHVVKTAQKPTGTRRATTRPARGAATSGSAPSSTASRSIRR